MPRNGECIYTIYPDGHVQAFAMRNNSDFCRGIVEFGNWFTTREEAEKVRDNIKSSLRVIQAENKQKLKLKVQ